MRLRPTRPTRPVSPASRALLAPAAVALATALLAGCGSDDGSAESSAGGGVTCDYTSEGAGEVAREVEEPPTEPQESGDVPVVIELGQGEVSATLDAANAPCAVNSFLALAEQDYFDDTPCHRLTTFESEQGNLLVLQCGDPTGSGFAGPGYTFADELTGDETYPAGTIAMANAGPDTNGSQFFLVYGDTQLDPAYTVLGTFDEAGVELVSQIAAEGVEGGGQDGAPAAGATIADVRVAE
ncbi:peptidylprolyl isomerase [Nocardioides perillae]|uniref:Peptidyl-prolyl cis-trans isomerase n=1 Tax=Nocardioides perillae TaxID=1119534 RepID=A0A7Y9RT87_9ACTN|nr:peptidylprolyl isomerase [Nocardioides perillae]NYG55915.1 peptidyl-prolyl cis-trans isomerase B (cyclophilin B) [Nocardioides perillae]